MKENFTQEDLVRYIYRELKSEEEFKIEKALRQSRRLKDQYNRLLESYDKLGEIELNPSQTSVDIILQYSNESASATHPV